jgi:riboflavin kinase/FMN adenylyltransferase
MIILDGDKILKPIKNAIVTSGTFDGVHYGHQKILQKVVKLAKERNGNSVVLTFWPHPRFVLNPNDNSLKLLSTFEEKAKQIENAGIDYLIKMPFTKEFSQLSSEDFINQIVIEKLGTQMLVIGYDHHFGKNREGSFEYLSENAERFGFQVKEIPKQEIDHVGVSSTKIRNALMEGKVRDATDYLGHLYELSGTIVGGKQNGSKMGFPTANIEVKESFKLIPKDGSFAVLLVIKGNTFKGMLNIGYRPTLDGSKKVIEANIFDFDEDIYGEAITVKFVKRLREEKKFKGIEALKKQLKLDKLKTLEILASHKV